MPLSGSTLHQASSSTAPAAMASTEAQPRCRSALARGVALLLAVVVTTTVSAAVSFVALGGTIGNRSHGPTTGQRSRVIMGGMVARNKGTNDNNFIDKAWTVMTDIVVWAMPLAQKEKDAYQFYRDGLAAQTGGDYSVALRAYAESLKLEEDPLDRSYIFYNLGLIFSNNGEYVKAVKYYHLALDQNKEMCQAYNNIAVIYHDQGIRAEKKGGLDKSTVLYEKAAQYWNNAIRIAPTNYLEAQSWLMTTGRVAGDWNEKLGGIW